MTERFKTVAAVMLIMIRETDSGKEILLQKRKNTGFKDGRYDLGAVGHVEANESLKQAMIREAKEELDIDLKAEDLEFVNIIHKQDNGWTGFNMFFTTSSWKGEPKINEPEKNEEIRWCKINELPENLIEDRALAVKSYLENNNYNEVGWDY